MRQLRERLQQDAILQAWMASVRHDAEAILHEPLPKHELPDGLRLLATSKQVLRHVYTLALVYRVDGDRRYLQRLWRDLEAVAAFPDWNPKHFLDTAEMTHACAIAYDWLYNDWTAVQRRILRDAIVKHGLKPGLRCYIGEDPRSWWCSTEFNWNQVCNGGLIVGAIAVVEDEPELADQILGYALKSLPIAMREFAPDGACREGPGYWNYACDYTVVAIAALESAFGTDFGLCKSPGFQQTANFLPQLTGPSGMFFNFADCPENGQWSTAPLAWLSNRFELSSVRQMATHRSRTTPLDIIWYRDSSLDTPAMANVSVWRRVEAMSIRTDWSLQGSWIAFKAGCPNVNHAQCDLGTFVFEAKGQRWAIDLGKDDYNLPGYFEQDHRWDYYRNRAEGHNTLVVNGDEQPDQRLDANTKIDRWNDLAEFRFGIIDLSPAYSRHYLAVQRGVGLADDQTVVIQDELVPHVPARVHWAMHTRATIQIADEPQVATLSQGGQTIYAQLLSPDGVAFSVRKAKPAVTSPQPAAQDENRGVRVLCVECPVKEPTTITVCFHTSADFDRSKSRYAVTPLANW